MWGSVNIVEVLGRNDQWLVAFRALGPTWLRAMKSIRGGDGHRFTADALNSECRHRQPPPKGYLCSLVL